MGKEQSHIDEMRAAIRADRERAQERAKAAKKKPAAKTPAPGKAPAAKKQPVAKKQTATPAAAPKLRSESAPPERKSLLSRLFGR